MNSIHVQTRTSTLDPTALRTQAPLTDSPYGRPFLRLSALKDLYIYPLYVLVNKILSSILNSPAPIHPLYHPLSTLFTVGPTCHFI
jgi:hypothetical protein